MNALTTIERILDTHLVCSNLKLCVVDNKKRPFTTQETPARVNEMSDFVELSELLSMRNIDKYAGIGMSIQANKICAIDVDNCFSEANNIDTINDIGRDILNRFKSEYCEFSFSGTGLRILFFAELINNYNELFYIKNAIKHIEFYQPSSSFRYVTITGNAIFDNDLHNVNENVLLNFLNTHMKRKSKMIVHKPVIVNAISDDKAKKLLRYHYFTNAKFQDVWFTNAPGSGKDESERDFYLISYLYENITQDKTQIKMLFESSPFFKSKDWKHQKKWTAQNYRYYNYLYEQISKRH